MTVLSRLAEAVKDYRALRAVGAGAAILAGANAFSPVVANAEQGVAQQRPFTNEECKGIAAVAGRVVRALGKDTLSVDFRQSFVNWLAPNFTCDGPRDIVIRTERDAAAFTTIRGMLDGGTNSIDLVGRAGLRTVAPTASIAAPN